MGSLTTLVWITGASRRRSRTRWSGVLGNLVKGRIFHSWRERNVDLVSRATVAYPI